MNAETVATVAPVAPVRPPVSSTARPPASPRFDAKFIEEHRLLDRYLEHQLPYRGARDLENWYRANPDYLERLKLAERAQASLALLEAMGKPLDLSDPKPPWWKSIYVPIALAVITLLCLLAVWVLFSKLTHLRGELEDTRTRVQQGSLVQPAKQTELDVAPDRAAGVGKARISLSRGAPQLIDLHVDMGYSKEAQFRLIVDKQGQGRALIVQNLLKDSNGELRLTFNTSGLAAGIYDVRIESLPFRGTPAAVGWLLLEVQ